MKKKYLYIGLFLELAACVGACLMQYFTKKKMGMLRWVNHLSNKMTKSCDLDLVFGIVMILVALAVWYLIFRAIGKGCDGLALSALFCSGTYIAYTIAYTRKLASAYYLVSPVLLLGALISIICLSVAVRK